MISTLVSCVAFLDFTLLIFFHYCASINAGKMKTLHLIRKLLDGCETYFKINFKVGWFLIDCWNLSWMQNLVTLRSYRRFFCFPLNLFFLKVLHYQKGVTKQFAKTFCCQCYLSHWGCYNIVFFSYVTTKNNFFYLCKTICFL